MCIKKSYTINSFYEIKDMQINHQKLISPCSGRPDTVTVLNGGMGQGITYPKTKIEMGAFTQDFEYVENHGDLDECNGRVGVTPEFPDGIYYYVVTDDFPYFSRCLKGDF